MLARMDIDVATLRRTVALAGFDFTEAELDALRPGLDRALEQLRQLEMLSVGALEPTTHFRIA
jgi:Asp-tRNA(Asn)/Glu-tRNA(Gln) amidotransferase C subunit